MRKKTCKRVKVKTCKRDNVEDLAEPFPKVVLKVALFFFF